MTCLRSLTFLLILGGCAGGAARLSTAERSGDAADRRDGVGVFVSTPRTFDTNSYYIVGPSGVIVIDTQFTPSEARRAIDFIEQETGKPIVLAIVLHPNPDKFNGTATFQAHGVRVLTSKQVLEHIPRVHEIRTRAFGARHRGDWPQSAAAPEPFGDTSATLEAGGLELRAHVLGRGCSDAHVAIEWRGHLFVGDLVAEGTHAWLELGYVDDWIARLDELEALRPRRVHPGRGSSRGVELLATQRRYLERVSSIVREAGLGPSPDQASLDALRTHIEATYPTLRYAVFLRLGLPAVVRAVASTTSATSSAP